MRKTFRCYAEGSGDQWEAICLDLDIAVQGESFREVYDSLHDAIVLHLESLEDLPEGDRRRLIERPAPLSLRLQFALRALAALFRRNDDDHGRAEFTMPCTA